MIDWQRFIHSFVATTNGNARRFGIRKRLFDSHLVVALIGSVLFGMMLLATGPLRTYVLETTYLRGTAGKTSAHQDPTSKTGPRPKVAPVLIKLNNTALAISFLLVAMMIVAAKLLAYRNAKKISQPIAGLSYAIRRLAAGHRVEDLAIHRDDEFEDLINSFNELRETVVRDRAELSGAECLLEEQRRNVARPVPLQQLGGGDECVELINVNDSIRELQESLQNKEDSCEGEEFSHSSDSPQESMKKNT